MKTWTLYVVQYGLGTQPTLYGVTTDDKQRHCEDGEQWITRSYREADQKAQALNRGLEESNEKATTSP